MACHGAKPARPDCTTAASHSSSQTKKRYGWLEIHLGEFFNERRENDRLRISLKEAEPDRWKAGLVVEGWHYETPNFNFVKFVSYQYYALLSKILNI